jgi:hypothetical protein
MVLCRARELVTGFLGCFLAVSASRDRVASAELSLIMIANSHFWLLFGYNILILIRAYVLYTCTLHTHDE